MSRTVTALPDDAAALKALVRELQASLYAHDLLVRSLRAQIARLKKQKFGASSEKIAREIEQLEPWIACEIQAIECGVRLLNVLVKRDTRRVSGENLHHHDLGRGKPLPQVRGAGLDPFGRRLDARLGREKHVVVADQQHAHLRFETVHAAVIEPPQDVLRLVAADPDVHRLPLREVFGPCGSPLLRDRVSDQQHVDGPS